MLCSKHGFLLRLDQVFLSPNLSKLHQKENIFLLKTCSDKQQSLVFFISALRSIKFLTKQNVHWKKKNESNFPEKSLTHESTSSLSWTKKPSIETNHIIDESWLEKNVLLRIHCIYPNVNTDLTEGKNKKTENTKCERQKTDQRETSSNNRPKRNRILHFLL